MNIKENLHARNLHQAIFIKQRQQQQQQQHSYITQQLNSSTQPFKLQLRCSSS